MTLTLRIENFDMLDDGGPTWLTLDQRGASVGRRSSMDWVLPDPDKRVSSHHFDVTFRDGAYWLTDMSTNGTYLADSYHRIEGTIRISGGERIIVGHYLIVANLAGENEATPNPFSETSPSVGPEETDPWNLAGNPLEPVNPLPPPTVNNHHLDDVAFDFVPLQRPDQRPASFAQEQPPAPQPMPTEVHAAGQPPVQPLERPGANAPITDKSADAVLAAFLRGAQLPDDAGRDVDPVQLAEALGVTLRGVTEQVMAMLRDRAYLKQSLRTSDRTMTTRTGNNPLKFMENANEALDALFLTQRDGFTMAPDSFEGALQDLHSHEAALVAALQPALSNLLSGLSPEEIAGQEEGAGKRFSGSKKSRNWDKFVATWDDKASAGDNGMLDAYLKVFIEVYIAAASRNR